MSQTVISVEHLSKSYRLGQIGTGTLTNDMKVWFARKMGKPNPLLKIGQEDHGSREGETLWALNDVSFTVEQGEVLGIIGRNGAGKSTLLKILSRVTAPTSGCVKVKGRIASLLEVGTGFHPELTGRENIYLNGAILGMTRQEIARKFDEIVDFAEIEKFIDTPVKRYSSGMYVRLAFAVAAHLESEILLVDEVLAVGDSEFQKKCLGKMGDVSSKEGRTVLFVSHNMAAVENLCTSSLILSNGKIKFTGITLKTIEEYLKTTTSDFSIAKESILKKILIEHGNGNRNNMFEVGEDIYLVFNIDFGANAIRTPYIGIGCNTFTGQRIFTVASFLSKNLLGPLSGNVNIRCKIANLNIAPGDYTIKLAIGDNPSTNLFEQEDIIHFSIAETDFFGNGKLPNKKQGLILVNSEWTVQ